MSPQRQELVIKHKYLTSPLLLLDNVNTEQYFSKPSNVPPPTVLDNLNDTVKWVQNRVWGILLMSARLNI